MSRAREDPLDDEAAGVVSVGEVTGRVVGFENVNEDDPGDELGQVSRVGGVGTPGRKPLRSEDAGRSEDRIGTPKRECRDDLARAVGKSVLKLVVVSEESSRSHEDAGERVLERVEIGDGIVETIDEVGEFVALRRVDESGTTTGEDPVERGP